MHDNDRSGPPVPVAGLLLAAGGGRRLGGRPKALLPHGGGLLVERAAEALRAGGCTAVHVVLGAGATEVLRRARLPGCVQVECEEWEEGIGRSLRAGLASLASARASAAVILLVDQPRIGAAAVRRVSLAADGPSALATATYAGAPGHPVLLGRDHWAEAAELAVGDRGARDLLRGRAAEVARVPCDGLGDPADIDVPADLGLLEQPEGAEPRLERG